MRLFSVFLTILLVVSGNGLNILVYNPIFGASHCNYFNRISDVLVKAGHKVVQLSPILNVRIRSGTTQAERITIPLDPTLNKELFALEDKMLPEAWTAEDADPMAMIEMIRLMQRGMKHMCSNLLNDTALLDNLRSQNFDIFLSEPMDICGFGISHAIGIPQTINCLSFILPETIAQYIGCPTAPSYVPAWSTKFGEHMTFGERFGNVFSSTIGYYIFDWMMTNVDDLFRNKFGQDFPSPKEIMINSTFVFTNADPLIDFPSPRIHKVIDIGGIAVPARSTKRLDQKWQRVLSLRQKTILLSFGTIAQSHFMPDEMKRGIQKALRSFPDVTFIWKYEKPEHKIGVTLDEATADGDNIITIDWMPQTDLLSDPRLAGFITHGGLGSTNEGTMRGVPLVVIPVMGDQFRNAKMVERLGSGILFTKKDLADSTKLSAAIRRLMDDELLRSTAKKIGAMVESRPFDVAEMLVKYTEFAAKMGPFPQLVPHGKQLSFIQYFLLDVAAVVVLSFFTTVFLIAFTCRKLCNRVFGGEKLKSE